MHPGPMNRGVEIDSAVADDPQRSLIREQVEMGVAVRMAVLDMLSRRAIGRNELSADARRAVFTGVRLLDPASGARSATGDLLVRDGLIAAFGPGLGRPGWCGRGDRAAGAVLCPGLVDMRAALGEPGDEYRETIASAAEAAAAGGITTLVALPDTLPGDRRSRPSVRLLRARGEETGSLTILPYAAATKGLQGEELAEIGPAGRSRRGRLHRRRPGGRPTRLMRLALSYARGFGTRHRAAPGGAEPRRRRRGHRGRDRHPARPARRFPRRPKRSWSRAISAWRELTGGAVHVAHVSTGEALELIRQAKADGLPSPATPRRPIST